MAGLIFIIPSLPTHREDGGFSNGTNVTIISLMTFVPLSPLKHCANFPYNVLNRRSLLRVIGKSTLGCHSSNEGS